MKVVINACHGGFGLSDMALAEFKARKGITDPHFYEHEIDRDDPVLVDIVETFGNDANTRYSELKIVEIPDDIEWYVEEYDGREWVAEAHRTWD